MSHSPTSEAYFRQLCLIFLSRHGYEDYQGGFRADIGKCWMALNRGQLEFRDWRRPDNSSDEAIVLSDMYERSLDDLSPYIEMLEKELVLDALANI